MTKSSRRSKHWLIAGLAVLVISVIIAVLIQAGKPVRYLDRLPVRSNDIVLFGDSHFELFEASEILNDRRIRNRGYSGETSRDLLPRADEITRGSPRRVLLLAGANDAYRNRREADFLKDMRELIGKLQPRTGEVVVVSIPPSTNPTVQERIASFNGSLKSLCEEKSIEFIDLSPVLLRNGLMDPELTDDSVHLNETGYQRILPLLKPKLKSRDEAAPNI